VKWTRQETTLATEFLQQLFENTRKPIGNLKETIEHGFFHIEQGWFYITFEL